MRVVRVIVVGCLLLGLSGCSNNRGKIVGRWESTSGALSAGTNKLILEFSADNTLTLTVFQRDGVRTITGTYSLSSGDTVFFNNLSIQLKDGNRSKETIKITDDQLTITGEDGGLIKFKRI